MQTTGSLRIEVTLSEDGYSTVQVSFQADSGGEPITLGEDVTVNDGGTVVVSPLCLECNCTADVWTEDGEPSSTAKAEQKPTQPQPQPQKPASKPGPQHQPHRPQPGKK